MKALAGEVLGLSVSGARIVRLKQDASLRSYFRIATPEGASWVVMAMPRGTLKKSEEGGAELLSEELPFLNVHRYLQGLGMAVPEVLRFDEARGMMLLEDLGDTTLEAHVHRYPEALEPTYAELVDMLACLRARAEKAPALGCLGFQREFDQALYLWELEHFREWGLDIWSSIPRTEKDNAALSECFEALARTLTALPRGLTHRDFQSRNLMLKQGRWHLIDFQDALQAPRAYDLVALLRDSYIELKPDFVRSMVAHYVACFARHGGEAMDEADFAHSFDLLTVHRKLKDAARFEYIARQKHNPGFLPFIPASLRYAHAALSRLPELARLQGLLARWLPEFA
jgi:aminoglycoside/choline kinase family phosphotransferase